MDAATAAEKRREWLDLYENAVDNGNSRRILDWIEKKKRFSHQEFLDEFKEYAEMYEYFDLTLFIHQQSHSARHVCLGRNGHD